MSYKNYLLVNMIIKMKARIKLKQPPLDHLCLEIFSSCEAEVADVDVVGEGERELPVAKMQ